MRTTLTLDPDVAERLRQRVRASRKSFKETVNEALRVGLAMRKPDTGGAFRVRPHRSAFVPGVDPAKLNQLADDLEAEGAVPKR